MYDVILQALPFHREATSSEVENFLNKSPSSVSLKINNFEECLYVSDGDDVELIFLRPTLRGFEICFFNNNEIRGTKIYVNNLSI